jgi:hypothetical protein
LDASPTVDRSSRASPDMLKLVTGFLHERLNISLRAKALLTIGLLSIISSFDLEAFPKLLAHRAAYLQGLSGQPICRFY